MLRENGFFFLPNLLSLENGNTYLGSFMGLRFRVMPDEVKDEEGNSSRVLKCLCWYGEYCLEESEVVSEAVFPLSKEGREEVIDWLEEEWGTMMDRQLEQQENS